MGMEVKAKMDMEDSPMELELDLEMVQINITMEVVEVVQVHRIYRILVKIFGTCVMMIRSKSCRSNNLKRIYRQIGKI